MMVPSKFNPLFSEYTISMIILDIEHFNEVTSITEAESTAVGSLGSNRQKPHAKPSGLGRVFMMIYSIGTQ